MFEQPTETYNMDSAFQVGDLVWAKMKGFSPWPGRVSIPILGLKPPKNISQIKCIYFFGTNNYGWVKESHIRPYMEFKEKMMMYCNTSAFQAAVNQIDSYIKNPENFGVIDGPVIDGPAQNGIEENGVTDKNNFDDVTEECEKNLLNKALESVSQELTDMEIPVQDIKKEVEGSKINGVDADSSDSPKTIESKAVHPRFNPYVKLERMIKCESCNEYFRHEKMYKAHIFTHPQEIDIKSKSEPVAKRKVKKELKKENKKVKLDRPFKCPFCEKTMWARHRFVHLRSHSGEKPHKCYKCDKKFATTSGLDGHMRAHFGIKKYNCKYCDKSFIHHPSLVDHERRIHTNQRPYKCQHCGKTFVNSGALRIHSQTHTEETPYECELCHKPFKSKSSCNKHRKVHEDHRQHCCKICNRLFLTKAHLKDHLILHSGRKDFICKICKMAFALKSYLRLHSKSMHSGNKFECYDCGRVFPVKYYLRKHIETKHMLNLYCTMCMKQFIRESDLRRHKVTCRIKINYRCEICKKGFHERMTLLQHKRIIHDVREYECHDCGKKFSNKLKMKYHIQNSIRFCRKQN